MNKTEREQEAERIYEEFNDTDEGDQAWCDARAKHTEYFRCGRDTDRALEDIMDAFADQYRDEYPNDWEDDGDPGIASILADAVRDGLT